jgi:hypothetical protein
MLLSKVALLLVNNNMRKKYNILITEITKKILVKYQIIVKTITSVNLGTQFPCV